MEKAECVDCGAVDLNPRQREKDRVVCERWMERLGVQPGVRLPSREDIFSLLALLRRSILY